jgi:hypothetical protein
MPLNEDRFVIIDLPPTPNESLRTFDNLVLDQHCGGKHRYRRFSQYKMLFERDRWNFELLPHRPYLVSSKYNTFAGGFHRHYQPLECDWTAHIDWGAKAIPLDTNDEWQINVHQTRVITTPEIRGICVPEGPHRDGHEYVMIAVYQRNSVSGAEMTLLPLGGGEPFYRATLQDGQAVLLDDERMFHDVTDIEPIGVSGHRDIVVVAFSRWKDKWYGEDFEQNVLSESSDQKTNGGGDDPS